MDYVKRLIEKDLDNARDNLARARAAARFHNPAKEWGESGRTLDAIIKDYEQWEARALKALEKHNGNSQTQ